MTGDRVTEARAADIRRIEARLIAAKGIAAPGLMVPREELDSLFAEHLMLKAELADVRAKLAAVEALAEEFDGRLPDGTGNGRAYNSYTVAQMIRAALHQGDQGNE